MACCIVCGDPAPQPLGDYPNGRDEISKLSVVKFTVKIFLEVSDLLEEYLSTDRLCKWWTICEECSEVIQESLEIYRQLVKLTKKFRSNRQKFVDKCRMFGKTEQEFSNDDDLEPSRQKGSTADCKEATRLFQTALESRSWPDVFSIPSGPDIDLEESAVKDEVLSGGGENEPEENISQDFGTISEQVKQENDDPSCSSQEEDEDYPAITNIEDEFETTSHHDTEAPQTETNRRQDRMRRRTTSSFQKSTSNDEEDISSGSDSSGQEEQDEYLPPDEGEISSEEEHETRESVRVKSGSSPEKSNDTLGTADKPPNLDGLDYLPLMRKPGRPSKADILKRAANPSLSPKPKKPKIVRQKRPNGEKYLRKPLLKFLAEVEDIVRHPETKRFYCPKCAYSAIKKPMLRSHYRDIHLGANPDHPTKRYLMMPPEIHNVIPIKKRLKVGRPKKSLSPEPLGENLSAEPPEKLPTEPPAESTLSEPDVVCQLNSETKRYHCPNCHYSVTRKYLLQAHYKEVHLNDPLARYLYSCTHPGCGRTFAKKDHFKDHMDRHNGTPRYHCTRCFEVCYSYKLLIRHVQMDHEGGRVKKPYICEQCGKGFSSTDYLHTHKYQHHNPNKSTKKQSVEKVICEICGKNMAKTNLAKHVNTVHGDGDRTVAPPEYRTCHLCGKTMTKLQMQLHLWNIHREGAGSKLKWKCSVCQHAFFRKAPLDVHLYCKHQIGEPVERNQKIISVCDVEGCRCRYRNEEGLKAHMEEIHGPDRNKPGEFQCRYCGKGFFHKYKLEHHELSHKNSESKPFKCDTCGRGFQTPAHLRMHLVTYHKFKMESRQGYRHFKGEMIHPGQSVVNEQQPGLSNVGSEHPEQEPN